MSRFRPRNPSYWLAHLCESNFGKLIRLIPDLSQLDSDAVAFSSFGKPALHLTLVERSRYTLTVDLNYCFDGNPGRPVEPRFRIRVYLDGKCAEALHQRQPELEYRRAPRASERLLEVLEEKWSINYFLQRWLDHCLTNQYRFERDSSTESTSVCV